MSVNDNPLHEVTANKTPAHCLMVSWRLVPFLAAALVLAPVGVIVSSFFAPASDIWQHLVETTLPLLLTNTLSAWRGLPLFTNSPVAVSFLGRYYYRWQCRPM